MATSCEHSSWCTCLGIDINELPKDVLLELLRTKGTLLYHLSEDKQDVEIVITAIMSTYNAVSLVSKTLHNNILIIKAMLKKYNSLFSKPPQLVRMNALSYEEMCRPPTEKCICEEYHYTVEYQLPYYYISPENLEDKYFIMKILELDIVYGGGCIESIVKYIKPELIDKKMAIAAVLQIPNALDDMPQFNEDEDVVIAALSQSGYVLRFVGPTLKMAKHIIMIAVSQWGEALSFVNGELRNDQDIIFTAITHNPRAINVVSQKLTDDVDFIIMCATYNKNILNQDVVSKHFNDDRVSKMALELNGLLITKMTFEDKTKQEQSYIIACATTIKALDYTDIHFCRNLRILPRIYFNIKISKCFGSAKNPRENYRKQVCENYQPNIKTLIIWFLGIPTDSEWSMFECNDIEDGQNWNRLKKIVSSDYYSHGKHNSFNH